VASVRLLLFLIYPLSKLDERADPFLSGRVHSLDTFRPEVLPRTPTAPLLGQVCLLSYKWVLLGEESQILSGQEPSLLHFLHLDHLRQVGVLC
jgi:hypothetical protein